jgi:hypothetical protein
MRRTFVPVSDVFVGVCKREHGRLAESRAGDLHADRQTASAESARNRDRRQGINIERLRIAE